MNQYELIAKYNEDKVPKFNKEFFNRNDDEIINELKNIILSCQRDRMFKIKVVSFTTVDDYDEIRNILYNYEESGSKNRMKNKFRMKENLYDCINLKDSDIKLLIVKYYIEFGDKYQYLDVYIAVPRIVNKFYFRLGGSIYSAMYQIVDASTYNNTATNSKKQRVVLKTQLAAMRMYKNTANLKTYNKETVKCIYYICNVFNKSVLSIQYLLAKFGFYGAQNFLGINGFITLTSYPVEDDRYYSFVKQDIFINVPKMLFDEDYVVQSFIYTLSKTILKDSKVEDCFTNNFWLKSLGFRFTNKDNKDTIEKGLSVLDSIEHIYDISTKNSIHLPFESKQDIYCIIRWIMGEFSNLRLKDNLDISTKRIRCAEYIAALYAMKLTKGIYRISDLGKRADIKQIKKAININPMYLIGVMQKCKLVNYRDMVNDKDAMSALKFTYKGIAGIGESSNNSVPNSYRAVHVSHLGRVDLNSSSASDPGLSGTICPLGKIYRDNSLSDFEEPNYWTSEFNKLMKNFKNSIGLKEIADFSKSVNVKTHIDINGVNDCIELYTRIIPTIKNAEEYEEDKKEIKLEDGGCITYGD